jgi:hypothetical protein
MSKDNITQQTTVNRMSDSAPVNALKCQFLTDMELAGMGAASRKRYLYVVERLIKHYWCSPAELTEQQVCDYMLEHHRQGPAKGTFKATHFGLRFFFRQTLGRDWDLFKKNETFASDAFATCASSRRLHANHLCGQASCISQLSWCDVQLWASTRRSGQNTGQPYRQVHIYPDHRRQI